MPDVETGLRWWLRYIVVPLVGGGGILTYLFTQHSERQEQDRSAPAPLTASIETAASVTPAPTPGLAPSRGREEVLVSFAAVDTASAPGMTVAAAPYLHRAGISLVDVSPPGSEVVLVNNRSVYQGTAAVPTASQNFLTQIGTGNVPASFVLRFAEPCDEVTFIRPALFAATESGVTHPAWSAHALDAVGRELSAASEGLTRSFGDVPARTFTLRAPAFDGIAALRFDSDPRLDGVPFAAFSAVLIESLMLVPRDESAH
jgi:hypothetical protein